jgi:hypothetical protein
LGKIAQSLGVRVHRGLPLFYANDHDLKEAEVVPQLLHHIVYTASNSLLDESAWGRVVKFIDNAEYLTALEKMIKIPGPAMERFTLKLLHTAIRTYNTKVARLLLRNGVSLNYPIIQHEIMSTRWGLGSTLAELDMARLLISVGADVSLARLEEDGQPSGGFVIPDQSTVPCTTEKGVNSNLLQHDRVLVEFQSLSERDLHSIYNAVKVGNSEILRHWRLNCTWLSFLLYRAIGNNDFATARVIVDYGVKNAMHTRIPGHTARVEWLLEKGHEEWLSALGDISIVKCLIQCFQYYTKLVSREYQFTLWATDILQGAVDCTNWESASYLLQIGAQASNLRGIAPSRRFG